MTQRGDQALKAIIEEKDPAPIPTNGTPLRLSELKKSAHQMGFVFVDGKLHNVIIDETSPTLTTAQERPQEDPAHGTASDYIKPEIYEAIKKAVLAGMSPVIFGPAGSGKSRLCKELAHDLGLDFFTLSFSGGLRYSQVFGSQTLTDGRTEWTPARENLLIELCGEIEDEDKSLVDRAEERAGRFEEYSEKRAEDADKAHEAVKAITDNIPFGQPILVGHHSEKHARKDAERIQNGMTKAVKMWEQSKYWEARAKGAIRAAKYKERPDVRTRRIKTLEADKRREEKTRTNNEKLLKAWQDPRALNIETAKSIANYDHFSFKFTLAKYPRPEPISQYEGDMSLWGALDHGIINAEQAAALAIPAHQRVIKSCDRWINHLENRLFYERAMLEESGGTIADRNKPEKGGACRCWVGGGKWVEIQKVNKVSVTVLDNWGNGGRDFTRTIEFDKLKGILSKAEWEACGKNPHYDSKPKPPRQEEEPEEKKFEALKEKLKEGVNVIVAPQLFPTPPELAKRMIDLAEIEPNHKVLEPSAGTGNLLKAIGDQADKTALEINPKLVNILNEKFPSIKIHCYDFLSVSPFTIGTFDRIVMNPPFENGVDIKHIKHALTMLNPGGRLVALCANGPRQRKAFQDMADYWEDLPEGSFKAEGTNVNTALLIIDKKGEEDNESLRDEAV